MSITASIRRARAGVAAMPILMGALCGGAMLATPILLLTLVFPLAPWNVQGQTVAYDELWSSGLAPVIALFLLLGAIASWGLALRCAASRWAAVATPVAPFVLAWALPSSMLLEPYQEFGPFFGSLIYAVGFYLCLFHIPAVQRYLADA